MMTNGIYVGSLSVCVMACIGCLDTPVVHEPEVVAVREMEGSTMEKATFGAGCFWGVEETFRNIDGVTSTSVGYSGGFFDNPTYEDVCRGVTGHTEVVNITYDPEKVSYESLLAAFWSCHDPTQVNRQGPDIGYQYRSVVFYHTPEQETAARESKEKLDAAGKHPRPIATQIEKAKPFWKAEEYHQLYLKKCGRERCRSQ